MIKKGKLLERKWHEEWDNYKTVEKSIQNTFNKEDKDKAKSVLGF